MVPAFCQILVYQGCRVHDLLARLGHFHLGPNDRCRRTRRGRMGPVGAKLFDLSGNVALFDCTLLLFSGTLINCLHFFVLSLITPLIKMIFNSFSC